MLRIVVFGDSTSCALQAIKCAIPEHGVAVSGISRVEIVDMGLLRARKVQGRQLERGELGKPNNTLDHVHLFN